MPKTIYDDLIMTLVSERELIVECDEYFHPPSFRSAFYRFKNSDIGRMMLVDTELKTKTSHESEVEGEPSVTLYHYSLVEYHKPKFKVRSLPNAPV